MEAGTVSTEHPMVSSRLETNPQYFKKYLENKFGKILSSLFSIQSQALEVKGLNLQIWYIEEMAVNYKLNDIQIINPYCHKNSILR